MTTEVCQVKGTLSLFGGFCGWGKMTLKTDKGIFDSYSNFANRVCNDSNIKYGTLYGVGNVRVEGELDVNNTQLKYFYNNYHSWVLTEDGNEIHCGNIPAKFIENIANYTDVSLENFKFTGKVSIDLRPTLYGPVIFHKTNNKSKSTNVNKPKTESKSEDEEDGCRIDCGGLWGNSDY